MVICLERGANLHMAQLINQSINQREICRAPLYETSTHCLLLHLNPDWFCLLVPAHLGSPRQIKGPLNGCVLLKLPLNYDPDRQTRLK